MLVNTCGFIDRAKEESVETILEQVERKKRGEIDRVVVAGCMVQKYGRELAAEIPEVDAFVGLDELENAPAAAAGLPTLPRFTDKPLATRLYDERAPRVLSRRRGLRVPEGRRGLRQPLHVLHDPADARAAAQPHDRVARRRGAVARGAGRVGARADLAGHDPLRRGPRAWGGGGSRGWSRRCWRETSLPLDPLPLRLPEDARRLGAASSMAREPRFVPYVDIPLQHVSRPILVGDAPGRRRGVLPAR